MPWKEDLDSYAEPQAAFIMSMIPTLMSGLLKRPANAEYVRGVRFLVRSRGWALWTPQEEELLLWHMRQLLRRCTRATSFRISVDVVDVSRMADRIALDLLNPDLAHRLQELELPYAGSHENRLLLSRLPALRRLALLSTRRTEPLDELWPQPSTSPSYSPPSKSPECTPRRFHAFAFNSLSSLNHLTLPSELLLAESGFLPKFIALQSLEIHLNVPPLQPLLFGTISRCPSVHSLLLVDSFGARSTRSSTSRPISPPSSSTA